MSIELPNHIIYWNGTTYKSLQNLVTRISMEDSYLFRRDRGVVTNAVGSMGIYFTTMPAIDLGPTVEAVLEQHADNRPGEVWRYDRGPEGKEVVRAWRAALRTGLKAAIEPITPLSYKG